MSGTNYLEPSDLVDHDVATPTHRSSSSPPKSNSPITHVELLGSKTKNHRKFSFGTKSGSTPQKDKNKKEGNKNSDEKKKNAFMDEISAKLDPVVILFS